MCRLMAAASVQNGRKACLYLGKWVGKLPQKQYSLKVDKMFNFKTVKDEKEHIQSCTDCGHSQRV